jgi:hypothetical protein
MSNVLNAVFGRGVLCTVMFDEKPEAAFDEVDQVMNLHRLAV